MHGSYNTASGKRCCNGGMTIDMAKTALVTIPQAVSAVATKGKNFNTTLSICCYNTASGKRCCNASEVLYFYHVKGDVTIPQAVSAVATSY